MVRSLHWILYEISRVNLESTSRIRGLVSEPYAVAVLGDQLQMSFRVASARLKNGTFQPRHWRRGYSRKK